MPSTATLTAVIERFATLASEPDRVRAVRGPAMALGMNWLIRLPSGSARDEALDLLEKAVECAVASACAAEDLDQLAATH